MVKPLPAHLGVLLLGSFLLVAAGQAQVAAAQCARTCHELNCQGADIRYGKYCGVGHTGCEGEEPCDGVDACCRQHDTCVEKKGLLQANSCHEGFIRCLKKQGQSGGKGFSDKCPYSMVIPTMTAGIELAMQFTGLLGQLAQPQQQQARVVQPRVVQKKSEL